ncbi:MAG: ferredoxin [Acidimicrobiia bacterium]
MGYRVEVDPDCCISSGNCVRSAPSAFSFEDDVSSPLPGAADLAPERLVQIARTCPVGAIHLFAEDGKEIDPYAG